MDEPVPAEQPDELPEEALPEADVTRLEIDGKEILLIGTAHISQESVNTVRRVIAAENPDTVCVELDEGRFRSLNEEERFEDLDLLDVIKKRQLTFLMARLALMSFQKRMGSFTGVKPGAEMIAAVEEAEAQNLRLELVDRDVRTTLLRAWRMTPWWRRAAVAVSLLGGMFEKTEISEEQLAELRQTDQISVMLDEMGEYLPSVKKVLVDERDLYMAHKIRTSPGQRITAIVGAAHVPGLIRYLQQPDIPEAAEAVDVIPPKSLVSRGIPWAVPFVVLGLFILGFFRADPEQLQTAALAWVLANGTLSALGAMAALAHPFTIGAAFLAAPLTSLNPTIGAGFVTAFVQTVVVPPRVSDMESVGDDVAHLKGLWQNRLARIFLVFLFCSVGSTIGTFVALPWLLELL